MGINKLLATQTLNVMYNFSITRQIHGFICNYNVNHIFQPSLDDTQLEKDSPASQLEAADAGTSVENLQQHDGIFISLR